MGRLSESRHNRRGRTTVSTIEEFAALAEPYRRELLAHCYRMMGSVHEAEDLVQETYLRAWRGFEEFEGRSSLRTWLYTIATNAYLNERKQRNRRPLPSGLGPASGDPDASLEAASGDVLWLQPIPDTMVTPGPGDPASIVISREQLRLALIASLQKLTPRQRAIYLLREVLEFPAANVAAMLETSVAAVKSSLQRARAALTNVDTAHEKLTELDIQDLLEQYMTAFEKAALERALRKDAALEMVGYSTWFSGLDTCLRHLARVLGSPGTWRMVPVQANGQPAAAAYLRRGDGAYEAFGLAVLTVTSGGISRITVFGKEDLHLGSAYRALCSEVTTRRVVRTAP
ncbi:RNA polymerase subunit sigma-70 [Nonomuraea turkmeniaca]|uniref:RNA polymerase subunit sigma-70 n=1 Tax=Nonomuraea turkmeniaca TaxID=103838 RepID=UPI003CCC7720